MNSIEYQIGIFFEYRNYEAKKINKLNNISNTKQS